MSTLSDRMKERMTVLDLTQDQLATLASVSQTAIHKLLTGKSESTKKLPQLARALECSIDWLAEGTGHPGRRSFTVSDTGQGSGAAIVNTVDIKRLPPDERRLLEDYRDLNQDEKRAVRNISATMAKQKKQGNAEKETKEKNKT